MRIATYAEFDRLTTGFVGSLHGRILEIGAGRGSNFDGFAADVTWIGLEPSARPRRALAGAAAAAGHGSQPLDARAEAIPLPNHAVDGVLGTFVLCSVDDVAATLSEIRRVVVPGGRVVFAEHVAARSGTWKRRAQAAIVPLSRLLDRGCRPNRDTETALSDAGFTPHDIRRYDVKTGFFGLTVPCILYDGTVGA